MTFQKLFKNGKETLKNGYLLVAEKFLEKAIQKEKLQNAENERNCEIYFYLAELLERKAEKPDAGLLQRQKWLLQAAALLNFVRNFLENQTTDSDTSNKLLKTVLRKIQDIQDNLVLSVGGNPLCSKFDTEDNRRFLVKLRENAKCYLESIQRKYHEQEGSEEYLQGVFVELSDEIRALFKSIASEIKRFLAEIIEKCLQILGKAPCDYEIMVLGSLAREEMTPYSDLEWAILISSDDEKSNIFFRNLTNLVHLQVRINVRFYVMCMLYFQ